MKNRTFPSSKNFLKFYVTEEPNDNHANHESGTELGFWIYLMSDCILFAVLFIVYSVLGRSYAAGFSPVDLFDLNNILVATFLLLFSSITYGFSMLASAERIKSKTIFWLCITAFLGICFLVMEFHEFRHMIFEGATPQRSAFLSSFFALVGTHGLHVFFGLIWLSVLIVQVLKYGLISDNQRRLMCLSMFWHFLDLIWIGVFSFVYLIGVI
ncbi:Cytochrome O ubiquinol oxidase subunit III [Liberibacter crescens BT-1]|uniref:Cytochrome bo(3) ubiquinol oxidase subunit 3 n=2 Tax=Liberibacter crescens TaxID=1273132 RepID=L0EUM5_LIBCB|nr:Cytochrome O ubiquinol oxidase subunit III [Liberibacter crescens BT-1]AMC13280.1 cytochrome o ubiquinol oxidase subunit III [Liberibacter crescens]